MHLVFDVPIVDNAAYPRYELELTALSDFLLARVSGYHRIDTERAERCPNLRTEFNRTHEFKLYIPDRALELVASKEIDRYVHTHFGKRPVFSS